MPQGGRCWTYAASRCSTRRGGSDHGDVPRRPPGAPVGPVRDSRSFGVRQVDLLKAVGGYLQPTEGEIRLAGEPSASPVRTRAMVFQEFDQLLPGRR